jgi:hypothetical protein
MQPENVKHPEHYCKLGASCAKCQRPIECITIAERFNFNLGCVIKYIWRHEHKYDPLEDLQKAQWYLQREIMRIEEERLKKEFAKEN